MQRVEFITLEADAGDLVLSFALAPAGQQSLTLQRALQYEHLLPEEERRPRVCLSSMPEGGDHLTFVAWSGANVEVRSTKHTYLLDASAISQEEKSQAVAVLRQLASGGVVQLRVP